MKRCLVFISGIAEKAYGKDTLVKCKEFKQKINKIYGQEHIKEIHYQPIMDKFAFLGKSLLDPVRLLFSPTGWAAEKFVQKELQKLTSQYDEVDVITHSQGSWMVMKSNVKIRRCYNIANPIGWFAPLARWLVQLNIGKPKLVVDELFYIYSTSDLVSKRPPKIEKKWTCRAEKVTVINTETVHDLDKYFIALNSRYPYIFN